MNISLGQKILLLWFVSILLLLGFAGGLFHYLIVDLGTTNAQATVRSAFTLLKAETDSLHRQLKSQALTLQKSQEIGASVSMIDTYQNPYGYDRLTFDLEKEFLAREISKLARLTSLDRLALYDSKLRLVSFFIGDEGQSRTGIISYELGERVAYILPEGDDGREIREQTLDLADLIAEGKPKNLPKETSVSFRSNNQGEVIAESRVPLVRNLPGNAQKVIGVAVLSRKLDEEFIRFIQQITRIEFDLFVGNREKAIYSAIPYRDVAFAEFPVLTASGDHYWKSLDDYFVGGAAINLPDGRRLNFVMGQHKSAMQETIATFRQSLIIVMILGGLIFFPVGALYIRRFFSTPINNLLSGIDSLREGRDVKLEGTGASFELDSLARSFSAMARILRSREETLESIVAERTRDLVHENAIRENAERTLVKSEHRLSAILAHAVDGIITINQHGIIETVNPAAVRIFGYSESEMVGENVKMLMPSPYHDEHDSHLNRYVETLEPHIIGAGREVRGLRKDGIDFPLDLAVSEQVSGGERFFTGIIRDISERYAAETELLRNRDLFDALVSLQTAYIAGGDSHVLFDRLLKDLLRHTESKVGFITEVRRKDDGQPYLSGLAVSDLSWDEHSKNLYDENQGRGMVFDNLNSLFGAALVTGETVISNDPANDSRSGGLPPGHPPLESFLGVPLYSGGEMIGMIGVANRNGGYDEELESYLRPLFNTYASIIASYIAERQRQDWENQLVDATEKAGMANQAKSEFLAGMSHELRTPLNAIIGFAEIMRAQVYGPFGDEKYTEYITHIHESGNHLLNLINDILDVSAIEAGKVTLQERDFDLFETVSASLLLVSKEADKKSLTCSNTVEADSVIVHGDERRLRQVLLNLLYNAVKFTPDDGVITVHANRCEDGGLDIVVVDTGIGIGDNDIDKAMSEFGQVDSSLAREYEGTGLGLPLAKNLCELHGGTLELASEPGEGTTVTVHLPPERAIWPD